MDNYWVAGLLLKPVVQIVQLVFRKIAGWELDGKISLPLRGYSQGEFRSVKEFLNIYLVRLSGFIYW
ncbi:hypothetical protein C7475_10468 [Chitinophaga sp. S165]|nr:hypothetical protein C7475_10468 [Chitinophaga sp. S165]